MRKIAQFCGIPALILLSWGGILNPLFLNPLAAQNLPNPNPNFPPPDPPSPLPPPEELLTPPSPPTPLRETLPPDRITVTRYEVRGSTVFSEEQLQAITAPFTGEGVTFDQLVAARSAVEQLYLEHQYLTSGAYLPLQTIQGGVVIIQVVEGRIAEIEMQGLNRLPEQYIRRRLPNAQRVPLHLPSLEEEIQLLQQNPLIAGISANLIEGENPGENVLDVTVQEASPWQVQVGVTNDRVPTVGTVEGYGMISWGNVGGWGDRLGGSYRRSEGSEGWEVSYALPLNAQEGTLGLRYNLTNSRIIDPVFEILQISSRSRYWELTVNQPVVRSLREEFTLGFSLSHQVNETFLQDIPFPLSVGADSRGVTRVSVLGFSQTWLRRSEKSAIALRSQFNWGVNLLDPTRNNTPPDGRFFTWLGRLQWVHRLTPDTTLILRGTYQWADRPLLGVQQLSVGGRNTVRGYRQDLSLGDHGFYSTLELQFPLARLPEDRGTLYLTPFLDYGRTWRQGAESVNTLAGLGTGMIWQIGDSFQARLDWGVPVLNASSSVGTWQEQGLHFSLQLSY